jgi:hypothetical protein
VASGVTIDLTSIVTNKVVADVEFSSDGSIVYYIEANSADG